MERIRKLALTFDGAPNPPATLNVLAKLDEHGVKGTFFMEGHRIEKEPDTAREVKRRGHEIGNHSYSHPMLDQIPLEEARVEIEKTDALLREVVGVETKLVRPPAGALNHELAAMLICMGYEIALWSPMVPIYDWAGPDAAAICRRILSNVGDENTVLVFHDRVEFVPDVLDTIIPVLRDKGFTFVTMSQMDRKGVIR